MENVQKYKLQLPTLLFLTTTYYLAISEQEHKYKSTYVVDQSD